MHATPFCFARISKDVGKQYARLKAVRGLTRRLSLVLSSSWDKPPVQAVPYRSRVASAPTCLVTLWKVRAGGRKWTNNTVSGRGQRNCDTKCQQSTGCATTCPHAKCDTSTVQITVHKATCVTDRCATLTCRQTDQGQHTQAQGTVRNKHGQGAHVRARLFLWRARSFLSARGPGPTGDTTLGYSQRTVSLPRAQASLTRPRLVPAGRAQPRAQW